MGENQTGIVREVHTTAINTAAIRFSHASVVHIAVTGFYCTSILKTTALRFVLFLNKFKPRLCQDMMLLVKAGHCFEAGDPKNFMSSEQIADLANRLIHREEKKKLSRIVNLAELKNNDYNISSSRYIHTGVDETYRPIGEIMAELIVIETEARQADKALRDILRKIGVSG